MKIWDLFITSLIDWLLGILSHVDYSVPHNSPMWFLKISGLFSVVLLVFLSEKYYIEEWLPV